MIITETENSYVIAGRSLKLDEFHELYEHLGTKTYLPSIHVEKNSKEAELLLLMQLKS